MNHGDLPDHLWEIMAAARVPADLPEQEFGLWRISRRDIPGELMGLPWGGWERYTILQHLTLETLDTGGEIVMEDSIRELLRHMPIWRLARGRVLINGLGLGCVVRGLLAKPEVEHIDVVEIDPGIFTRVGLREWRHEARVTLHLGDALTYAWSAGERWDYAWHDLHDLTGKMSLDVMHAKLLVDFADRVGQQGAWMLRRWFKRIARRRMKLAGRLIDA